jgi:universal stress protein E
MEQIRLILAVLDPTATDHPALAKAGQLARATGACLRLFCCDRDARLVARLLLDPAALSAARAAFLAGRRDWLAGLAEPWSRAGVSVEIEAAWDGPLHAGILREVALARPDLVVKDTHWHGPLRRGLFTSTDWYLVQDCTTPLLLVKPRPWPPRPRIAAAVDPGHPDDPADVLDHAILGAAERMVGAVDGEHAVVHAYLNVDPMVIAAAAGMPLAGVPAGLAGGADLRASAAAALQSLLEGHRYPQEAVHLLEGAALEALPAFCERLPVDILAVGVMSRSRLFERVIGSTAERLLDRVPCDLLVVHARPRA